jgi:hypothetical protein
MTSKPKMQSWAAEVIADNSGKWCGNALRFATEAEALDYASDLAGRWFAVRETRAVESPDPVNYVWQDGRATALEIAKRPLPQPRSSTMDALRPKMAVQSKNPGGGNRLIAVRAHCSGGSTWPGIGTP